MPLDSSNILRAQETLPDHDFSLTVEDKRLLVEEAFTELGVAALTSLQGVEHMDRERLRSLKTSGTILEVATKALTNAGIHDVETIGRLMDELEVSQEKLHMAFCYCLHGAGMTGHQAAEHFIFHICN